MGFLLAFNGYVTFAGLVLSGLGSVLSFWDTEIGKQLQDFGLLIAGIGAARKGVKTAKGI